VHCSPSPAGTISKSARCAACSPRSAIRARAEPLALRREGRYPAQARPDPRRRFMRPIVVAFLIAALPMSALAADNPGTSQDPLKKEKRVSPATKPTGSRLEARTCRTSSEWAEIDKANQEHADREVDRVQAMTRSDGTGFNPN